MHGNDQRDCTIRARKTMIWATSLIGRFDELGVRPSHHQPLARLLHQYVGRPYHQLLTRLYHQLWTACVVSFNGKVHSTADYIFYHEKNSDVQLEKYLSVSLLERYRSWYDIPPDEL